MDRASLPPTLSLLVALLLCKPGLGGDAGLMILRNEMSRILALPHLTDAEVR